MIKGTQTGGDIVSNENMVQCERPGCDEWFSKRKHNQRYHNNECCRLATNVKIMEKYHERRKRRLGLTRMCSDCNATKLSRYNDDRVCSACKTKNRVETNSSVLDMLSRATA